MHLLFHSIIIFNRKLNCSFKLNYESKTFLQPKRILEKIACPYNYIEGRKSLIIVRDCVITIDFILLIREYYRKDNARHHQLYEQVQKKKRARTV